MGSDSSTPALPDTLSPLSDPNYGTNIKIDGSKTRVYQIIDIDEQSIDNFTSLLNVRKTLNHPALLTVMRSWIQEYRQKCSLGKMYRVTLQYAYMSKNLQNQIGKYCNLRMPVPEKLVRSYFYDVVSCLQYLRKNKTCHGDIKPKTILISQNGHAFLADSYFINGGRISFQIVMQDPESLSLLSPSQLQSLRNKKYVTLQQVHKDQIFQIGLSMMQAMTAEPAMECYDLANLKIKPQFFSRKYQEMVQCGYTPQLCQLVMSCTDLQPEKRINFQQFLQGISALPAQNFNKKY